MASTKDIARIAAAMHALRPDWPEKSLITFLTTHHADRPWMDLAVAGVVVALDVRTRTPNLLNEHGSWWVAAYAARGVEYRATTEPPHDERCPLPGHGSFLASNCGACRAEQLEEREPRSVEPDEPSYVTGPALVRSAMRRAGIPVKERRP